MITTPAPPVKSGIEHATELLQAIPNRHAMLRGEDCRCQDCQIVRRAIKALELPPGYRWRYKSDVEIA